MSGRGSTILRSVAVVVVALLLAVLCRIFVVEMYTVAPQQMEGTLLPGDRVLVEKWHYGVRLPQFHVSVPAVDMLSGKRLWEEIVKRNDVVAYNYPTGEDGPIAHYPTVVARCIGVPGDIIEVQGDMLYINDEPTEQSLLVTEAYLVPDTLLAEVESAMETLWGESLPRQSVGKHSLFYIDRNGYNKLTTQLHSSQLPQFVTLSQDNYRVELPPYGSDAIVTATNAAFYADIINRYEPCMVELRGDELYCDGDKITSYRFSQPYYWVLCDNRTASTDSRSFGVLPHSHIIGRCGMIVFSIDAQQRGFDSWRIDRFFQYCKL